MGRRRVRDYRKSDLEPPQPEPYPEDLGDNACTHKTPCGHECVLLADVHHRFHTCRNANCPLCHGVTRFGGRAAPVDYGPMRVKRA